ncbi:granzyme M-like [Euwallacea similis]|uniref:granzyme M-like n=1 Tax=Euwallacea similis TaxID=1736056 RepID=UPI00344F0E61
MIPKLTCLLVVLVVFTAIKPNALACEVVASGEHPYIVWVDGGKIDYCIGILIQREYVITLAECFYGDPIATVFLGHDISPLLQHREINIEFSKEILFNDSLALVKLQGLLYMKEPIQKATLLSKTESLMLESLSQTSTVQATLLNFISHNVIPYQIHLLDQNICNYFYGKNLSSKGKYCIRYDTFPDGELLHQIGSPTTIGGKVFGLLLPPKKGFERDMFRFVLSLEPYMDWIEKETQSFQDLQLHEQITCLKRIDDRITASIQDMKQEIARALNRISKLEQKAKTNSVPTEDPFYFRGSGSGYYDEEGFEA